MITKEEATAIAVRAWDEVDYCAECDTAFVFGKKDHRAFGGPGPVVVLKDSGDVVKKVSEEGCPECGGKEIELLMDMWD